MIQKIKDLMKLKDELDSLNKQLASHSEMVVSMKTDLQGLKEQMHDFQKQNKAFLTSFQEDTQNIRPLNDDLKKEIYDFGLLKAQLQQRILDKFEQELKNKLNISTEKLEKDMQHYTDARRQVEQMAARMNEMGAEVSKLLSISKNIRKEDFELTHFANKLLEMDREKLSLMQKIDTLERLISKLRRSDSKLYK